MAPSRRAECGESDPVFTATFRFYEELNDLLPLHRRKRTLPYRFRGKPSVKDAIEAHHVPHTEVDLIVVDGVSVGFDYHLKDGDRVAVYPVFEALDISPIVRLRPEPLRRTAFVLDVHLGKLARRLRLLGLDATFDPALDDPDLARVSVQEHRILLTRDRRLLQRRMITHGYWIRSQDPPTQVVEVLDRFDLRRCLAPFTRCVRCNGRLEDVDKAEVLERLEPKTRLYYDRFRRCASCRQVYWRGSHFERLSLEVGGFVGG